MSIIEYRVEDGVAVLSWDQKDRSLNVVDAGALASLDEAIRRAVADDSVKGVILTSGKKGSFVAGGDLAQIEAIGAGPIDAEDLLQKTSAVLDQLRRMETCGKPIVAALNGLALGGGYEIALACHRRILVDSRSAKVGLPEAGMGLMPGAGGTVRLPRLVGLTTAIQLILEGKQLTPDEALKKGLVDEVVAEDDLLPAAKRWLASGAKATQPWDEKGYKVPGGGVDDPKGAQVVMGSVAMVHASTYGNFPHAKAILSAIYEGMKLPVDRAGKVETRYFLSLLQGPVARNMLRTLFFGVQNANKGVRRPKDVPVFEIAKLGVVGAGLMGAGLAFVAAKVGLDVVLLDRDQATADKGKHYAEERLRKDLARGRTTEDKVARTLARIHPTTRYEDLAGCDVVVEAVFENREVKADVTRKVDAVTSDRTLFGTNTSGLPITGLAEASIRPASFLGMHFFSPVERMPLVEVIRGKQTSDEALAKTYDFIKRIGKTPIVVNDSRSFYTSRVFGTYITEGAELLKEGVLPALIENCGKMSGMPMPPLALSDEVGLALMHHATEQAKKDLGDAYEANAMAELVELLVARLDRQGKRNGKGFYDYGEGGTKTLWQGIRDHYPVSAEQPAPREIIDRLLFTQCLETARCIEAGVITSPEDCDVGAILGWGFAAYTGGPCSFMDTYGLPAFVTACDALAARLGKRFSPPQLLRDMARDGKTFHAATAARLAGKPTRDRAVPARSHRRACVDCDQEHLASTTDQDEVGSEAMDDPRDTGWHLDLARYEQRLAKARVLSAYFRPEYHGFDVFRRPGGMMVVTNHGLFGMESAALLQGVWDASRRAVRGLGDRVLFTTRVQRRVLAAVGGAEGSPENAHLLLTRGEICWACPGGAREALASARDRYRLFWEGHDGFVRAAIRASVPIVPMGIVGSDELLRQLYDADEVRRTAFGRLIERFLGPKYVTPIYAGLGPLPLPMKLYFFAGEPIEVPADPTLSNDEDVVQDLHARATRAVEELLANGIRQRRADEASLPKGATRVMTRLLHLVADEVDEPPDAGHTA